MQRILCDIAARDLSVCTDCTAREVEFIALRLSVRVRARIHGDRMRLVDRRAREEVLPLRPAAVCLTDRAARDRERIVLRAAIFCNRIARARRRMRARRDGEHVVLRRIAVDGDTCIRALRGRPEKLRRLCRQHLRRILIVKPQQADALGCTDSRGVFDLRSVLSGGRRLAVLVVVIIIEKRRCVVIGRQSTTKTKAEVGCLVAMRNLMVEPRLIVLDDNLIPVKLLVRIDCYIEHIAGGHVGVRPMAVRCIQAVVEDELHRLKVVDPPNTVIRRCYPQDIFLQTIIIAWTVNRNGIAAAVYLHIAERRRIVELDTVVLRRPIRRITGVDRSTVGNCSPPHSYFIIRPGIR